MNSEQDAVMNHILNKYSEKTLPLVAMLEITAHCNLKCRHCYIAKRHRPELDTQVWLSVMDQLAELGTLILTITGGEVFMRADFLELIRYARTRHSFLVNVLSNVTMIDEKTAQQLKELGVQKVSTSIYHHTADGHDAITGVKGSFEKTLQAVRLLRKYDVNVIIKTIIMEHNFKDLLRIQDLAYREGAEFLYSFYLLTKEDGTTDPIDLQPSVACLSGGDKILSKLSGYADFCEALEHKPEGDIKAPCGAGKMALAVNAQGDVHPCLSFLRNQGNVLDETIAHIWSRGADFKLLRTKDWGEFVCNKCELMPICQVCIGENLKDTGSLSTPSPFVCQVTHKVAKFLK